MIAAIENKILEILKAAEPSLGYSFDTLETYPEDWQNYFSRETTVWGDTAAWVTFAGFTPLASDSFGTQCEGRLGLIVAARNYRNQRAARHGGDGLVGTYQILEDAIAIFNGNDLGLSINPLEFNGAAFVALQSVIENTGLVPMAIDFKFETYLETKTDGAVLGAFETLKTEWDLPPLGNPAPSIDRTDTLNLEQDNV